MIADGCKRTPGAHQAVQQPLCLTASVLPCKACPCGCLQEDVLYIAMAGQHQIWRHHVTTGVTQVFSGDGAERNANGGSGRTTSWAQPSGLSLSADGRQLWVADSESSSIRSLALADGAAKVCEVQLPLFRDPQEHQQTHR